MFKQIWKRLYAKPLMAFIENLFAGFLAFSVRRNSNGFVLMRSSQQVAFVKVKRSFVVAKVQTC